MARIVLNIEAIWLPKMTTHYKRDQGLVVTAMHNCGEHWFLTLAFSRAMVGPLIAR
jgi:hypothetical protein